VALVGAGFAAAARPAPAAADERLRILQFNLCGSICNRGVVDRPGAANDVVEHVHWLTVEHRAHLLILNEVCEAQFLRIRRLLARSNRPMRGVFHAQRSADRRCPPVGGQRTFGDAVLSVGPAGLPRVFPLPNRPSGGERRAVLCLPTTVGRRLLVCGLHLVAADPVWNRRQLAQVSRIVRREARSRTLIVAGDFNNDPWDLAPLTDRRRGGPFTDVDFRDNQPTHAGRKIDYILVDDRRFDVVAGWVHSSPYSDHRVLVGEAVLNTG
jgi:endonuclease/exonuclease/phosphatase family metal-dependent hydrolase